MITMSQANVITNMLQPFRADHKHPEVHTYGDMWQAYPTTLQDNGIAEADLRSHAGNFYCGMDRNANGEQVMVFQKSLLQDYIKAITLVEAKEITEKAHDLVR